MGRHDATPIVADIEQIECRGLTRNEKSARGTKSRTGGRYAQ
jgi:hypothetical protein